MSTPIESPKMPRDEGSSKVAGGRRRFLGAGSSVAILASLKSGSALAEGVCVGPSAFTSIVLNPATSRKPTEWKVCHSHGYWKNHSWPINQNMQVTALFSQPTGGWGVIAEGITAQSTLFEVVDMSGGGENRAFAADLISAYLDAYQNAVGIFEPSDIQAMWALVFCGTPYTVNGTPWTTETVRAFLNALISPGFPPVAP